MQRTTNILLLLLLLFASGCASAIYGSGKYQDILRPGVGRSRIVQELGDPVRQGHDRWGRQCDIFLAQGKIAPPAEETAGYKLGEALTLGTGDIIWTPIEVVRAPFCATGQKEVFVFFDDNGKYLCHEVHAAKNH